MEPVLEGGVMDVNEGQLAHHLSEAGGSIMRRVLSGPMPTLLELYKVKSSLRHWNEGKTTRCRLRHASCMLVFAGMIPGYLSRTATHRVYGQMQTLTCRVYNMHYWSIYNSLLFFSIVL